ncbi:MAG: GIY-YIG nuclease family protein [Bacteroidota bacterium]
MLFLLKWGISSAGYPPVPNATFGRGAPKGMYQVYVLYSNEFDRFYVGMSGDAEVRLAEHNAGKTTSTRQFIPWKLVLVESYKTRVEARKREKYLKSAAGRRWRKKNIKIDTMGD